MKNTDDLRGKPQEWYDSRIEYLSAFVTEERMETLRRKVADRTRYITICAENTFHPQNASALVRTAEAFGVQDIHTIEELCRFKPNVRIVRGTDKWVDIRRHRTTPEAIAELKRNGYRIVATMPHDNGHTPLNFDVEAGRMALIFGTEHAGVSPEIAEAADDYIQIPMCGMVESLNVSASASILLYNLTSLIRGNPAVEWQLTPHEQSETLFLWLASSIKDSRNILSRFLR